MNKQQEAAIEKLHAGDAVEAYVESGNSMRPIIKHRQPVRLEPVDPTLLEKGDVVLVKVRGNIYTHLVSGTRKNEVQISNNHGRVNGWTHHDNVYGIVTAVDGTPRNRALTKVKKNDS